MNTNSIGVSLKPDTIGATANRRSLSTATQTAGDQRDVFMTLLVAQLKNQDPLQPQDGAQFVAQLAQFNSLDQLIGIKQSLDQLIALSHRDQPTETQTRGANAASLLKQV